MTLDRTKPPPGLASFLNGYIPIDLFSHCDNWDALTLTEAWVYFDRITKLARIELLREIAAEIAMDSYPMCPDSWSSMLDERADALERDAWPPP